MSLRWHVPLPGPIAYSRPIRKRKKSGGLTGILVWFIVTPFKLLAKAFQLSTSRSGRRTVQPVGPLVARPGIGWPAPGWYTRPDGRVMYWDGGGWWIR